jgi:hypothetical protein
MTFENLKDYKQRLLELSKEDKKKRDEYLRQLANGTIQGPPVGYPSVDPACPMICIVAKDISKHTAMG